MEAVDNLSSLVELEIPVEASMEEESDRVQWLDATHIAENREAVKETFRTIHNYLEHIYRKEKGDLKDPELQRGINAIMVLAGEAAQKLDKYTSLFKGQRGQEATSELKEYKDLQDYYHSKITKRFSKAPEKEQVFEQETAAVQESEKADVQRKSLKDLETVRRDKEYELFYIRKENGMPFFNPSLLRHVRLVGEFDETLSDPEGDDPLLKIKMLEDVEAHTAAKEILHQVAPYLDEYYKEAMHHKSRDFVISLNNAVMALMLAANPRNRITEGSGKHSLNYFIDFHTFLRSALESQDYQDLASLKIESEDAFTKSLMHLTHALCTGLFTHVGSHKAAISFIQRLIEKGEAKTKKGGQESVWNELLENDEQIRYVLKRYPSGPLLKTLDLFREGEEKKGFDPLAQENFPSQLYTLASNDLHVTALRFPAPIHQELIAKAEIAPEFRGFLRALQTELGGQKHLLFNLQDRTSWREHARCSVLEKMQNEAEFSKALTVITICKNTDFYNQSGLYQNLGESEAFISSFKDQIASGESCGFFFPSSLDRKEIEEFTQLALAMIHESFFGSQKNLSRKERLDFIEIFYQFLFMKLILMVKPDSMSFTCKDGLDVGEATAAGFFAFIKMFEGKASWTVQEKEFLLWMLYTPALLVRERPIDATRLMRMVSAMSQIDTVLAKGRKQVVGEAQKLLAFTAALEIKPAA